jgi:thiol-disulfide isomerase/thioredoxin
MPSRAAIALLIALAACHHGPNLPDGDVVTAIAAAKPVGQRALDPAAVHGKPAIVLFVSPTCPYCLATLPRAVASASAHGATMVAVFTSGRAENARGVLEHTHFEGTALVDDGSLVRRYHITHVPLAYVLDRDGTARDAFEGEQDQSTFDDALAKL